MPTTQNKEFQRIRPIPDGLLPNTEIFYLPSTNEVFLEYDDYFERMIQLNSSCWNCTITGRASLTYDEALKSEQDAIEQINTFPAYLEVPILFLVHRFTGRARLDELVSDVTTFMRDRYFMDEKVTYRQGLSSHDRRWLGRVVGIDYRRPPTEDKQRKDHQQQQNATMQNGQMNEGGSAAGGGGGHLRKASSSMGGGSAKSPSKKSPTNKEDGLELCPPECITYTLKILNTGGEKNDEPSSSSSTASSSTSSSEEEENVGKKGSAMPSQVSDVPHAQIGRGKLTNITRAKIKLFIRYYTELSSDGCIVVKPSALADFDLDRSRWQHIFAGPEPKFPHTKRKKTSTTKAGEQYTPTRASALSAMSLFDDSSTQASSSSFWGASPVLQRHQNNRSGGNQQDDEATAGPSSSTTGNRHHHHHSKEDEHQRKKNKEETLKKKPATSKADDLRKKRQIHDQQLQLEPLFRQAEKAGVLQLDRWCQSRRLLTDAHIAALREAIHEAKEAERKRQVERRRREREALAEWRKPRDDLLCEDLKPFPEFKALRWPDWVPREHYWDILTISSFFHTFAELLRTDADDQQSPCMFNIPQIATALVSRQIKEISCFYRLLDTLLNALTNCINQDDGNAADLSNPDHVGNEVVKDFDHPVHGKRIRRINRECSNQFKIHGAKVWELSRDFLDLSEVIRLLLITSGFYTKWRRQLRGLMHCYEDDGFLFVEQHPDIIELLEKTSVYALNPSQRVRLISTFMDQLLRHSRFRKLIDDRIDELWELRRRLKQLKAVDQQHEKEARDALQHIQQHGDRQQQAEDELLDKDEQKARAAAQRELTSLRRALVQLNEGRRVKDISDLRERVVDAQRPLPWRAMADVREVHEFRAVQRNFHADKQHALLHEIFQLQGKMCMFLLGRDRAFRSYYYMNSAIIIFCPRPGELGHCWGERTPMVTGDGPVPEEAEEEEVDDDDAENDGGGRTGVGGRDHQRQEEVPTTKKQQTTTEGARSVDSDGSREAAAADTPPSPKQNGRVDDDRRDAQQEARKCAETGGDDETSEEMEKKKREEGEGEESAEDSVPSLDALMACTGGSGVGMEQCLVHNPPSEWPQLLFFVERDGVHKLLEALNPRGFREMELADNISLFRDIYNQEMLSLLDSTALANRAANLGAHLFGFSRGMPKELKESAPLNLDLFDEVRSRLLELEELLHQRNLGSPCCSTNRQEWRVALETYGDTSMLCQGNCVPLIRPSSPTLAVPSTSSANGYHNNNEQNSHTHDQQPQQQQQNGVETTGDKLNFLYTREELSNTTAVPLSRVQKLGIALMQLVHGIRRDCFLGNFMNSVKRNGIVKILPTPSFVEWQRALKECQSPSAIALFETTLEFSVDWEFKGPETVAATVEQQKSKNAAKVRRKRMPRAGANAEQEQDDAAADGPSTSTHMQHTRQRREVDNLLVEAGYMGGMAIGARKRKPVTKYGDVEMDVDKLDFDEEDEEEEEGEDGEMDAEEIDELKDADDEEEDDNDEDDEEMLMDMGGRAVSTRQRKPVTKYGAVEMDVDNLNLDEEEKEEKEDGEQVDEEEKESSLDDI